MLTRRRLVTTATGALAVGSAGCLDLVFGGGLEFEAAPGSVSEAALDETGYEEAGVRDQTIERTVEVGGQSRDVQVTNKHAEYERAVDFGGLPVGPDQSVRAAVFTVVTTPAVEVLGRTMNPVDDMEAARIAQMAQQQYDGLSNLQKDAEESVDLLGETTTAHRFVGDADLLGVGLSVDLVLYVTDAVRTGEDFALVVAGYPRAIDGTERSTVGRLLAGVQHDG